MPVSKKRKGANIKHICTTGKCKTLKGKQVQNNEFHVPELTKPFDIRAMLHRFPNMKNVIAKAVSKS